MPRRHRTESKTSPRRIAAVERSRQALALRLGGASFVHIAQMLGFKDRSGAYRSVIAALNRVPEMEARDYRKVNLERLNIMRLANWPQASGGDPKAIEIELKLQEREARYLGLDRQPTDAGAQAAAVAGVQVLIQVGDEAVPLGEWRRRILGPAPESRGLPGPPVVPF